MKKADYRAGRFFSLIELLVVVSIIAILAGLLLPVLAQTRERAKQIQCSGNLKQIGTAVNMYVNDYNNWIPHAGAFFGQTSDSWKKLLLPYFNKAPTDYNGEHGVFNCPSQKNATCGKSTYGDEGFYGGYGWNWMYLGWQPNTSNPPPPAWIKISQCNKPAQTVTSGDTSDYFMGTSYTYRVFGLYNWSISNEDALNLSYRHSHGGNYLWLDGHITWHQNQSMWQECKKSKTPNWFMAQQ